MIRCWKFGKWSWKFRECLKCGVSKCSYKTRHKGNGLCIRCFDKKRGEKEGRKKYKRLANLRWWGRVKARKAVDEDFRLMMNKKVYDWQKKAWRLHRKNWKKSNLKLSYRRFILSTAKNRTKKGIEVLINDQRIKTPIRPGNGGEHDDTPWKIEMFKSVYKELQAK